MGKNPAERRPRNAQLHAIVTERNALFGEPEMYNLEGTSEYNLRPLRAIEMMILDLEYADLIDTENEDLIQVILDGETLASVDLNDEEFTFEAMILSDNAHNAWAVIEDTFDNYDLSYSESRIERWMDRAGFGADEIEEARVVAELLVRGHSVADVIAEIDAQNDVKNDIIFDLEMANSSWLHDVSNDYDNDYYSAIEELIMHNDEVAEINSNIAILEERYAQLQSQVYYR